MEEIIKKLIAERKSIDDEDYIILKKFWEKEATELSKDIKKTIEYMLNDCTEDEFSWISEVFDGIIERTHSQEFIDCLYKVAEKYPEETKKYNIMTCIEYAEGTLEYVNELKKKGGK